MPFVITSENSILAVCETREIATLVVCETWRLPFYKLCSLGAGKYLVHAQNGTPAYKVEIDEYAFESEPIIKPIINIHELTLIANVALRAHYKLPADFHV